MGALRVWVPAPDLPGRRTAGERFARAPMAASRGAGRHTRDKEAKTRKRETRKQKEKTGAERWPPGGAGVAERQLRARVPRRRPRPGDTAMTMAGAGDRRGCSPGTPQPCHIGGVLLSGPAEVNLSMAQAIIFVAIAVAVCVLVGFVAALLGRRSGRRAISQRLASLGTRLGLDPPEDEYNVETSLAYLEQVTGGAAQAVTESSSDAIRLRRSLDTLTQGVVLCDENGTVIYRNGRANALMISRHGDALAAQAVTDVLEDAWHEGSAERTLDLYGPPRRTLQVRARQIDDGRRPLGSSRSSRTSRSGAGSRRSAATSWPT